MAQTDRQTDRPATHWNAAVFDSDDNWSKLKVLPPFVKEVHSQQEICPDTQRPHFQVHVICHRQVRLTQMCSWIKATKWQPVRGKEHIQNSIKYTSKKESAVPGTHEVQQGERYYQLHELLLEVAKQYDFSDELYLLERGENKREFAWLSGRLVRQDLRWANKLSNPQLKTCWDNWGAVFKRIVSEYMEETSGAFIIEAPPDEDPPASEECLIE